MPCHDHQRSQAHHHRRWRHHNAATVVVAAVVLTITFCIWFALIYTSRYPKCWQAIQEWQSGPVSFPWEEDSLSPPPLQRTYSVQESNSTAVQDLSIRNIIFGISGSAQLWPKRKEYVKLWWRPDEMRGFVWLEEKTQIPEEEAELLPQVLVSEDISRFRYSHSTGHPSGVRIARIVQEMFKLHLPNVCWFVLGDDDTIFAADNLVRVLGKYDHNEMYYVGSPSESHPSNIEFSHDMAFGGGGIAISYPLAETLSWMLDECLERYTSLFGSDDRLHACITELGVPLTKEAGFHQFDVHGNARGLLTAHPITPFVSIHHLEEIEPVFPEMDVLSSLRRLVNTMQVEPSSFLQQCICYDRFQKLSVSVSLGYVVQVFPSVLLPRELVRTEITFKAWNSKVSRIEFDLDTRRSMKSICRRPFVFYIDDIHMEQNGTVVSIYKRETLVDERKRHSFCFSRVFSPEQVETIQVSSKPMTKNWFTVPRRQCCKLMGVKDKVLAITVSPCRPLNW